MWWLAENGPQKAAHASPLAMNELAKNRLASAVNPFVIWHASPTKQSCIFTELLIEHPSQMMEFSQMTPVPMYTDASFDDMMVHSLRRAAPLISQSPFTMVFVISLVFTIFTLFPIRPRSGRPTLNSSSIIWCKVCLSALSLKCFTMKAAT